jgi:hypothetical protein
MIPQCAQANDPAQGGMHRAQVNSNEPRPHEAIGDLTNVIADANRASKSRPSAAICWSRFGSSPPGRIACLGKQR